MWSDKLINGLCNFKIAWLKTEVRACCYETKKKKKKDDNFWGQVFLLFGADKAK